MESKTVVDVGCGAGQEMLPFVRRKGVFGIGLDAAPEVGQVGGEFFRAKDLGSRVAFIRSRGEVLPLADASVDVVICRVALPYMNTDRALSEMSRVLRDNGVLFLKIHAPAFYFGMIKRRLRTVNPKQLAYPLICLAGSVWYAATGRQPEKGFWKGKEVFHTGRFLRRELGRKNMRIVKVMSDSSTETPSFQIIKS